MPASSLRAFSEKVAVVTDAANAFGRAVALQLALQGCYVVVGFNSESTQNREALTELQSIGTLASAIVADISTDAGVAALFDTVAATYGRLDLLVNVTLSDAKTNFFSTRRDEFDQSVDRVLRAPFFCAQAAVQLMQNRPSAAIVNLIVKTESSALSSVTTAALAGLTEALAVELAPKIRVNAVSFQTDETASTDSAKTFELLRQPGAIAPDDAARAALYLLSPEASAITGQIISVKSKRARI